MNTYLDSHVTSYTLNVLYKAGKLNKTSNDLPELLKSW